MNDPIPIFRLFARKLPCSGHPIKSGLDDLNPVSYTHLDVYKRQKLDGDAQPSVPIRVACDAFAKTSAGTCVTLNCVKAGGWMMAVT